MFEPLELRREANIGKDLKPFRSNSTEGIKETHALRFHQPGDDEGGGSAHADFTMDKELRLWITGRCRCGEVEELRERLCDILMHPIVDTEKQMMKVLLQERHLGTFIFHQAAHNMGDSGPLQLLNTLSVRSGAQIEILGDLTEEAFTQV
ncbi:MAG: hypothetical protein AMJ63_08890 [Myxococcales bacterium SG8_38_1]|nr:MAG: hypothetical protein AMJ63_08890 [Myxococcales bacterium SG8_38_1]